MKRSVFVTTAILGTFLAATLMIACGGGGSDSVPRSPAAYAGSSMPAFIGTTAYLADFEDLLEDLELASDLPEGGVQSLSTTGSMTMSQDYTDEGSISGTHRFLYSMKTTIGVDSYETSWKFEKVFSNYADSGDQLSPGILTGEGSEYNEGGAGETFDPEDQETLTSNSSIHVNFDSYRITVGNVTPYDYTPFEESKDGFMTWERTKDDVAITWEEIMTANFSYAYAESGKGPMYIGLLDASLTASYDGTATDVSTFVGAGTLCMEGDYAFSFYGCVDYDIDVSYDGNVSEPSDPPDGGTIIVSTVAATATYAFGTSESNPTCIEYSVIEAGASSAVFTTLECL